MLRSTLRLLALTAALLGITIVGPGTAMAEVSLPAPNNVGRLSWNASTNLLRVWDSTCGDSGHVAGQWLWINSDNTVRQIVDWECGDGVPATRVLNQPANATAIYLRVCVTDNNGVAVTCSAWDNNLP